MAYWLIREQRVAGAALQSEAKCRGSTPDQLAGRYGRLG